MNLPDIKPYLDKYDLIVQKDGDGGDSAQRIGMWAFGSLFNSQPDEVEFYRQLKAITIGAGEFVRNPDPTKWYSNPLNFSRDQTRALVMAMGVYGFDLALFRNLKNLILNFFRYPNIYPNFTKPGDPSYIKKVPDIASPEDLGEYIRAFYSAGFKSMLLLYPLVLLGDLFKLLGTLISVFYVDRDLTQYDDLNSIMSFLQAFKWMPTPLSWLARKIYCKFRPVIPNKQSITSGPESALWAYFSGPNDIYPMYELYKPLIEKYLK
jgi:hypothetical protein